MRKPIYKLAVSILLLTTFAGCLNNYNDGELHQIKTWAIQLQDADPSQVINSGFELIVMDYSRDGSEENRYSLKEIQQIREKGIVPIAYLSIGEAEDCRFYWDDSWYENPPEWLGRENPEWKGSYAVKYWSPEWRTILHSYLDKIIEEGFSGVYLDKVDEFEYWADPNNEENEYLSERDAAEKMSELILDIANYVKNKTGRIFYIILQNGEKILKYDPLLLSIISGWAAEDLFYNGTEKWSQEEMNWIAKNRIPYLNMVIKTGKPVFSVDYVDDGTGYHGINKQRIDEYVELCRNKGYIPYAALSDRELDELNVIEGIQPLGLR